MVAVLYALGIFTAIVAVLFAALPSRRENFAEVLSGCVLLLVLLAGFKSLSPHRAKAAPVEAARTTVVVVAAR